MFVLPRSYISILILFTWLLQYIFTSTWYVIAPPLLFVLSIFLTTSSLSNFYSLILFLTAIFLSINIPVAPLSKSTFTVMFSCISTFSTPMFSHTSFSILNVFLMSLCLSSSCTALFGTSVYALLYCIFPYGVCCHSPIPLWFLFSCLIFWIQDLTPFLFLYSFSHCILSFILCILYSCHLFPPCFFFSPVPYFLEKVAPHVFYLFFKEKPLSLIFIGLNPLVFTFPILYIGCYCLLYDPSSLKQKCLFQKHAPLITIFLYLFPCGTCQPSLLLYLLQFNHICHQLSSLLFFYFYVQTLLFVVPNPLTSKILYFLYSFLLPHLYFISHSTLHYPSHQHLISILGLFSFLFLLFFSCPTIMSQMFKLPTASIFSFSSSL